jgi:hypothetical protein
VFRSSLCLDAGQVLHGDHGDVPLHILTASQAVVHWKFSLANRYKWEIRFDKGMKIAKSLLSPKIKSQQGPQWEIIRENYSKILRGIARKKSKVTPVMQRRIFWVPLHSLYKKSTERGVTTRKVHQTFGNWSYANMYGDWYCVLKEWWLYADKLALKHQTCWCSNIHNDVTAGISRKYH